jgi:hypothetical protein
MKPTTPTPIRRRPGRSLRSADDRDIETIPIRRTLSAMMFTMNHTSLMASKPVYASRLAVQSVNGKRCGVLNSASLT